MPILWVAEFESECCCRITNAGLPSGLARLPYLKSIGLKRNCLTSVPRMLGKMHSLQEIYLEDNNDLEVSVCPCNLPQSMIRVTSLPTFAKSCSVYTTHITSEA